MIHQYKNDGYNMVLDVNSGSVHVVDDVTYEVLPLLDQGKQEEEIRQALKDRFPSRTFMTLS